MSQILDDMIEFNEEFVRNKEYEKYQSTKYPNKKIAVLSCMDTRLTELLPAALNIKNGDVKIIKNAGGTVTHPFGSVMKSLLICIYTLGIEEIFVVGHYDCGIRNLEGDYLVSKMKDRGVSPDIIKLLDYSGVDFKYLFEGFDSVSDSVQNTVNIIRQNPLIPKDIKVHGLIMHPDTGKLDVVHKE